MSKNQVLDKLISLQQEWTNCSKRIEEIKEELKPVVIERLKQLNYKEETFVVKGKGKEKKEAVRGFISWNEDFKDEDTGDVITIERHQVVMEQGEWYLGALSIDELINFKKS